MLTLLQFLMVYMRELWLDPTLSEDETTVANKTYLKYQLVIQCIRIRFVTIREGSLIPPICKYFVHLYFILQNKQIGTRFIPSPRFKKFVEIWLGSKLSLELIYGLSFRIKAASYFPQLELNSKNRSNILFGGFSW